MIVYECPSFFCVLIQSKIISPAAMQRTGLHRCEAERLSKAHFRICCTRLTAKPEGAIIINTSRSKEEIRKELHGYTGRIYTIDARKISMTALGKYFPNMPMLAAVVKVSGVLDESIFLEEMEISFKKKFASKPEMIEGNKRALEMALEEVQ